MLKEDWKMQAKKIAWVEKYRPSKLSEIAGNKNAISKIKTWIYEYKQGKAKKKALLFHGPPGSGKTSAAIALANELGYDYIETNASDNRTRAIVERVIGESSKASSLYGRGKIIIVDEVDGIHGRYDYGGLGALAKAIKKASQPIILTANDAYALPREFRELCELIEFKRISERDVINVLKKIALKENVEYEEAALKIIAKNSNGDLRAAINDLQSLGESRKITFSSTQAIGMRDTEENIFRVVARIFKASKCSRARAALAEAEEDPEMIALWIVENIPNEYARISEIAKAYNFASRSDIFFGRIYRRQDYALMRYAIDLLVCGVAAAKEREERKFTKYSYPQMLRMLSARKNKKEIIKSISEKIGRKCHVSRKIAERDFIPMLKLLFSNAMHAASLAHYFEFEKDEIKFFNEKEAEKIKKLADEIRKEKISKQLETKQSFLV